MMNFVLPLILFGALVNLFFQRSVGMFGFWMFLAGTISILWVSIKNKNAKSLYWVVPVMAFLGWRMLVIASGFLQFLLGFTLIVTAVLAIYSFVTKLEFVRSVTEFLVTPFRLMAGYFSGVGNMLFAATKPSIKIAKSSKVKDAIRVLAVGFLVGLPVVFVLLTLLTNADPVFSKTMGDLIKKLPELKMSERVIFTVISVVLFAPLLVIRVSQEMSKNIGSVGRLWYWLRAREACVAMGMVAVVIFIFLVIQWPYIFGAAGGVESLKQFGMTTYSEYVRKGFLELLFVAVILYGCLGVGYVVLKNTATKSKVFGFLQAMLFGELILFIVSILRRVWLYQVNQGWSLVRIYGGVFLVWVLGMSVLMMTRIKWKANWIKIEMVWTFVVIVFLGMWNTEAFIVRTNPPRVNGRVDYVYLSRMSADGVEGWEQALNWASSVLNKEEHKNAKFLNKEQRREIAYAEEVLRKQTYNFDILVRKYGPESDVQMYFDKLRIQILKQRQFELSFASQQTDNIFWKENLNKDIDWLSKNKSYSLAEMSRKISATGYRNVDFGFGWRFYEVQQPWNEGGLNMSNLDRILNGNMAEKNVYQMLKSKDVLQKLFVMQNQFILYQIVVLKQPESERSFDWDISTETPLLWD